MNNKPQIEAVINVEWCEVASWSEGADGEGVPCSQVHLLIKMRGTDAPLALRLKSPEAANSLIDALVEHRDYVWPQDEQSNGKSS